MREPSLRTSRLAIAGAIGALAAIGGAGFYIGRSTSPAPVDRPAPETPVPSPQPILPVVEAVQPLDRAGLIDIADAAADAAASGSPLPEKVREAVDRRFAIALPFGCEGAAPADSDAPLRWRYDEQAETLRVHVAVTRWTAEEWGLVEPADGEAIEGFWIARPWSSRGECRPLPSGAPTPAAQPFAPPQQTLAIAQFFRGDVRREALRDGKPFESVQQIDREDFAAPRGFRLILSGRIDRVPRADGSQSGPVHCIQPGGFGQRPRCIFAVTLDEVRIENPASGEVLANWPIGSG